MNGNWPDPARPGYPLNPERDGWHWLKLRNEHPEAWFWAAEVGEYLTPNAESGPIATHPDWTYLGPCLTPAEVAAQDAEIARLTAALAEARRVPAGWWVAPKEATQEMIGAAVGCGWGGFASAYRAMRDAAPQPPQEASHDD